MTQQFKQSIHNFSIDSFQLDINQKVQLLTNLHNQIHTQSPLNNHTHLQSSSFLNQEHPNLNQTNQNQHISKDSIEDESSLHSRHNYNEKNSMSQEQQDEVYLQMKQRYERIENENEQLKSELNELLAQKQRERENYSNVIKEINNKFEQELKQSLQRNICLQQQVSDLKQSLGLKQQINYQINQKLITMYQERKQINQQIQSFKLTNHKYRNQNQQLRKFIQLQHSKCTPNSANIQSQTLINQLHDKLRKMELESNQYDKQKQQFKVQIQILNNTINQNQNQIKILKIQYQKQIQHIKHQLECSNQKVKQLTKHLNQNNVKFQNNQKNYNFIKATLLAYKQDLHQLKIQSNSQIQQVQSQIRQQIDQLVSKLNHNTQPSQYIVSSLPNQSSLFNREEMLEFEIQELKKQLFQLKEENFELRYQKKKYQSKFRLKDNEIITSLRQQIESLKKKYKHEEQIGKQKSSALNELAVNEFNIKKSKQRVSKKRKQLEIKEADENIIREISEMRQKIKNAREQCQIRANIK